MSKKNEKFDHNISWQEESIAEKYDQRRFTSLTGSLFDRMEKNTIKNLLTFAKSIFSIQSVLDIPCGTGRISELLLDEGYSLTCGDISKEMIDVAKKKFINKPSSVVEYCVLDVYNIEKSADSYDCVSCIRLFQHLNSDERAKALKEIARVSKKFVIINVMYTSFYYNLIRKLRLALGVYAPRYTTSKEELNRELEFSSLRIVKSQFSQPFYGGNLVLLLEKE